MAGSGRIAGTNSHFGLVLVVLAACAAASTSPPRPPMVVPAAPNPRPAVRTNLAALLHGQGPAVQDAPSPLALTTTDGQNLNLQRVEARAVLVGPLAYTELHLMFLNPEDRQREGRFAVTLPPRAAISRFAMKIAGAWMEGEVVDKQRGRQVFEDFLHRQQDPALLEHQAGNVFSARVFPVEPGERKELIVAWSEESSDPRASYVLPLAGLPRLEHLSVRVHVAPLDGAPPGGAAPPAVVALDRKDFRPPTDLVVQVDAPPPSRDALRAGHVAIARLPGIEAPNEAPCERFVVLVDTSASMALADRALRQALQALARLAAEGGAKTLRVLAFDQGTEMLFQGHPRDFGDAALGRLSARRALGASDLGLGLRALGQALTGSTERTRVVLLTDGVPTLGLREPDALRSQVLALRNEGVRRLDVVTVTPVQDANLLGALVSAGLPDEGVVLDARADEALAALTKRSLSRVHVRVPGASWSFPNGLGGVRPGQPVLVFADLPEGQPLSVELSGQVTKTITFEPGVAPGPLLERAWVGAHIRDLLHAASGGDPARRQAQRNRAVELSVRHRVLCPETAFLVLASELEYVRYGLARQALGDILTVSPDGLVVRAPRGRSPDLPSATTEATTGDDAFRDLPPGPPLAEDEPGPKPDDPPEEPDPAAGAEDEPAGRADRGEPYGRLHGLGAGDSGSGTGRNANIGIGRRLPKKVAALVAEVLSGRCDAADVRKYVRSRAASLRACYETHLLSDPTLKGQVIARWLVAADGTTQELAIVKDSLRNPEVGRCMVRVLARIRYPQPSAGPCRVEARFQLSEGSTHTYRPFLPESSAEIRARRQAEALERREEARQRAEAAAKGRQDAAATRLALDAARPHEGRYAQLAALRKGGRVDEALRQAWAWRNEAPADVLAAVALGESLLAKGQTDLAARAFGSIADLYPQRADLLRFAGHWLERSGETGAVAALDLLRQARDQRPDHPTGHLALALALMQRGRFLEAFDALETGLRTPGSAANGEAASEVMRDLLGLCVAAGVASNPADRARLESRLREWQAVPALRGLGTEDEPPERQGIGETPGQPRLRILLTWETDANDVDLHVLDGRGDHAWPEDPELPSGGAVQANVRTGYGLEAFVVARPVAFPYRLGVHYRERGPMGFGLGQVVVIRWTGKAVTFDTRPFVLQKDKAWIDLGTVRR